MPIMFPSLCMFRYSVGLISLHSILEELDFALRNFISYIEQTPSDNHLYRPHQLRSIKWDLNMAENLHTFSKKVTRHFTNCSDCKEVIIYHCNNSRINCYMKTSLCIVYKFSILHESNRPAENYTKRGAIYNFLSAFFFICITDMHKMHYTYMF